MLKQKSSNLGTTALVQTAYFIDKETETQENLDNLTSFHSLAQIQTQISILLSNVLSVLLQQSTVNYKMSGDEVCLFGMFALCPKGMYQPSEQKNTKSILVVLSNKSIVFREVVLNKLLIGNLFMFKSLFFLNLVGWGFCFIKRFGKEN